MAGTNQSRNKTIGQRQLGLRSKLWPEVKGEDLWDRKSHDGYTTLPRTMPLILEIMDSLSPGFPVSSTYLDLWCRAFDEFFVTISNPSDVAFSSGFQGQRRAQAWNKRIDILAEHGFIKLAAGASGPRSYALIMNPHRVINALHGQHPSRIPKDLYNTLVARGIQIGEKDFS